jgi:integrase
MAGGTAGSMKESAMAKKATRALHLLTAREVHKASTGDFSDGGGLMLRVRAGTASWVLRYTAPTGKRREMGLGAAGRGSLAQAGQSLTAARDAAHKARELVRQGLDPLEARAQRRHAARAADEARQADSARERWTLARCARGYHARVIEPTKTDKHAAQWIASLENHIPSAIWHKPIATVTAPELLAALLAVEPHERARNVTTERPQETVRRVRQRLDAVFEDAIFHERCTANPAAAIKRKMREASPRDKAGEFAALPYREAPALMRRLHAADGTGARCLELALLTAARTNEVLSAEWCEFDLDAGLWVVPAAKMKAKEEHTVYLSQAAVELLKAQRATKLDPRVVFPSPMPGRGDKPLSNMAMLAVLNRLGVRDRTTVHGLCRSTFSTWANETGAARPDVIEACLAHHEKDKVRAAYNRAQFAEERRALLGAWAQFLTSSNVVELHRAA